MNLIAAGEFLTKSKYTAIAVLIIFVAGACSHPELNKLKSVDYQNVKIEKCSADSLNSYHILVPGKIEPGQKLPLVVALDAHGDGKLAVEKFQPAVINFPCLVAGSDLIKNNYQGFDKAIFLLITDLENKYPVDKDRIIIAGFSGGARMAYYFALKYPVRGLLMCGAGPGQQKPPCPVYTISGMGDFNFAEQYRHPEISAFNDDQFTSDYFEGIHEWPQPQQLSDGLLILLGNNESINTLREKRSHELIVTADSLDNTGKRILAWKALEKAAKISNSKSEKEEAINKGKSMLSEVAFRNTIKSLENDLSIENKLKQAYAHRSLTQNLTWWKHELTVLNKNLETNKSGLKADHYLRIKGFIGILLYTRINKMIYNDPDNPQMVNLLETYAFAEPDNAYAWYFKALHDYHTGKMKSCIDNLNKALTLGFTDVIKIEEDFPENIRKKLNPKPNYQ